MIQCSRCWFFGFFLYAENASTGYESPKKKLPELPSSGSQLPMKTQLYPVLRHAIFWEMPCDA
ncbi:MAG: hypothetical protein B9S37_01430 [Verrucomicrobiia bacterium Tous-C3TDCM]|nr:MAG: hypothetical protein B9S37_01430 [Verrucomicrobiae bacterium Tous-C3TDCM]PAZ06563.1 MAG: hypothetical protein CAK88_03485 [Verrucomicrobiae bacterium AMD-G2]